VHHFCVASDVEESNPLFDLGDKSSRNLSALVCMSRMRYGAYLDNFKNSDEYCSIDMFPCFMSWNSWAHCYHCARGKNRLLNSFLNICHVIGTPGRNSSTRRTLVDFNQYLASPQI
jgi:hypothetical protein